MFLQLCDMSDAVLDTCEGDFQGKLAPAHLALRLLASPASQPAAWLPPIPPALLSLHVAQTHQQHAYFTSWLPPASGRPLWLRSLWLSEHTGLFFLSSH